jgi:hypothetical protein
VAELLAGLGDEYVKRKPVFSTKIIFLANRVLKESTMARFGPLKKKVTEAM